MLLSYLELQDAVAQGVITEVDQDHIGPASIDLILGDTIYVERTPMQRGNYATVDLTRRESVQWDHAASRMIEGGTLVLDPGEFILAHTRNKFFMPNDLSAQFVLKSSLARNGLEHLEAGWVDPGFNNSVLTLELKNINRFHRLRIQPGMLIGQIKLFRHTEVPADKSYSVRGRYNNDNSVSPIKP